MSNRKDRAGNGRKQGPGFPNIDAVLPLVGFGFTAIPLHRYDSKAEDGRERGKAPRDKDWTTRDYDSAEVLATCLKHRWNVGIRVPATFVIFDIDPRNGGDEGFANLCEDFGIDPSDWTPVRTGSGGRHYFLRKPEGVKVLDTLKHEDDDPELGIHRYGGVEFKSAGRQMVAPGSWHPNGNQYKWELGFESAPILSNVIPDNLLEAITRPVRSEAAGGGHITPERIAKALEGLDPCDYADNESWLRIMMAVHHATGGEARQEFIEWSTMDPAYADHAEIIGRRWDSLHTDRMDGVTVGTLNHELHKHGRPDLCLPLFAAADKFDTSDFMGEDEGPTNDANEFEDRPEDEFKDSPEDEFESPPDFILNEFGRPKATEQANIRIALDKFGASVSYDQFADRIMIQGMKNFGPYLDDAALDRLWLKVDEIFRFRPSRSFFDTVVLDYARRRSFHPVREYFDAAQAAWDGKPRIDRLLIDYAGAEDTPYIRAVSALPLIATVRRVRKPGAKYDEAVVMESSQGKLKSTFLATLAIKPEWFTDSLPLHASQKETIEFTSGKLIVEFADLHGLKKADIDQVKAQLSRGSDRARLAYGKLQVERPRQWIPWGTANNDTYLRDQTGNRRFWPARIEHCDIPKLKADLEQLWGEAAAREAAGESIRLPRSLYAAATIEQSKRLDTKADPFTDRLADALGDMTGKIAAEDVWKILGITIAGNRTQHHNERMGAAMRYLGWTRKAVRSGGRKRPGYVKGDHPLREIFVHGEREDVHVSHDKDDGEEFESE